MSFYTDLESYEAAHPEVEAETCGICPATIYPTSWRFSGSYIEGLGHVCLSCSLKEIETAELAS